MLNALVAMDLPGPGTVFMSQSLKYLAPTYLGDTVTAEIEVLALKPDKPVCQLRAAITNQDGVTLLEGECWTYTHAPGLIRSRASPEVADQQPRAEQREEDQHRAVEARWSSRSCTRRPSAKPAGRHRGQGQRRPEQ